MKYFLLIFTMTYSALTFPHEGHDVSKNPAAGYKFVKIDHGSLYEKLGLKEGDIITKFNGTEVSTPEQVKSIYSKLKTANKVELTIIRNGKEQVLRYLIK